MKLFEIPIYAFDKKGLQDRISRWKIDNFGTNPEFADSIKNERKQYEYNHIVGFIEIYLDNDNIFFRLYLPYIKCRSFTTINGQYMKDSSLKYRYRWCTSRKTFLEDHDVNGTHFNIYRLGNEEIVENLNNMMCIMRDCVYEYNQSYHIDDEAFNAIKNVVDFSKIYELDCER